MARAQGVAIRKGRSQSGELGQPRRALRRSPQDPEKPGHRGGGEAAPAFAFFSRFGREEGILLSRVLISPERKGIPPGVNPLGEEGWSINPVHPPVRLLCRAFLEGTQSCSRVCGVSSTTREAPQDRAVSTSSLLQGPAQHWALSSGNVIWTGKLGGSGPNPWLFRLSGRGGMRPAQTLVVMLAAEAPFYKQPELVEATAEVQDFWAWEYRPARRPL